MARAPQKPARFAISVAKATNARSYNSLSHPPAGGVADKSSASSERIGALPPGDGAKGSQRRAVASWRSFPSCPERVRLDARINELQTEGRPRLLGYADQASSLTKCEITMPSLAEATVADGTETHGLCPAPEYAFAYPAVCPFILFDKVLTDIG
jgi:hypothetical protein